MKEAPALSMNRLVAQAFQPAGLADFRVRWTRNGRLESRPNPQARKPALRTRLGSWSQCAPNMTWRLPMNLKTLGLIPKSLRISGSWSQCATKKACRLSMNLGWFGVPPLGGSNGLGRLKPGLQAVRGSWSQCAASKSWRLPMNLNVGRAFQPAGLPDFPVQWTQDGRLDTGLTHQHGSTTFFPR